MTFFPYSLEPPEPDQFLAAQNVDVTSRGYSKEMLSAKYHTIFADADQRRVCKVCSKAGIQVLSQLPSPCHTCAATNSHSPSSHSPSRRLYERRNVHIREVQGDRFMPLDPALRLATQQLAESDALMAKLEESFQNQHTSGDGQVFANASHIYSFPARATRPISPVQHHKCRGIAQGSEAVALQVLE